MDVDDRAEMEKEKTEDVSEVEDKCPLDISSESLNMEATVQVQSWWNEETPKQSPDTDPEAVKKRGKKIKLGKERAAPTKSDKEKEQMEEGDGVRQSRIVLCSGQGVIGRMNGKRLGERQKERRKQQNASLSGGKNVEEERVQEDWKDDEGDVMEEDEDERFKEKGVRRIRG